MHRTLSIYLDFVRFSAAIAVLLFHLQIARFNGYWLHGFGDSIGHDAVMVFFVLSGFVIAYCSREIDATFRDFWLSRLSRLYSVVVPALVLTLVLDHIGMSVDDEVYVGFFQGADPVFRVLSNLFFVNEVWFSSVRPFSNGPFWSLSYEFWYYAIFSAFFYFSGRKRWVLVSLACLIAGPKILLLMPVWLLGMLAFRHRNAKFGVAVSLLLFVLPAGLYIIYTQLKIPAELLSWTKSVLGSDVSRDIYHSRRFLNSYVVGVLMYIHLVGGCSLARHISIGVIIEKPVRYFAGMTFSLYLMHFPLLHFYTAVSYGLHPQAVALLIMLTIIVLAPYTEGKKRAWREKLGQLSSWVQRRREASVARAG